MHNCEKCRSTDLVKVAMTLSGGPVTFTHCRSCEHRSWADADAGHRLGLPHVLEKVAS